jgi:hypothetical protein
MNALIHADDYTFTLDTNLIPTDERELYKLLLESQRDLGQFFVDDVNQTFKPNPFFDGENLGKSAFDIQLGHADYDGDHTDYNPAAADVLLAVTLAITSDIFWSMPINDDVATALGLTKDDKGHWPYTMHTRLAVILSAPDILMSLETSGVSWLATLIECNYDEEMN